MNKTLVLSALPYVNNIPHLGNIIGCVLSADCYARHCRQQGKDVLFVGGTDEYGTATEQKALEEKLSEQDICDKYNKIHKEVYKHFNISFDIEGRTTTDTHIKLVQEMFIKLYNNKYIIELDEIRYYCAKCNTYIVDRLIKGLCHYPECVKWSIDNKQDVVCNGDQCDRCSKSIDITKLNKKWCSICKSVPQEQKDCQLFLDVNSLSKALHTFNNQCHMTDNAKAITNTLLNNLQPRSITRYL